MASVWIPNHEVSFNVHSNEARMGRTSLIYADAEQQQGQTGFLCQGKTEEFVDAASTPATLRAYLSGLSWDTRVLSSESIKT